MKVALLAGNTYRAKAYAQILSEIENIDIVGILYGLEEKKLKTITSTEKTLSYLKGENIFVPDFNETLIDTFKKNNWEYYFLHSSKVNSNEVIETIEEANPDLIIYAGYGGQILRKRHFKNGRKYLHMHPGNLPDEKGSTTIYYSILNRNKCTVTSFFMNEKIDSGEIIHKVDYTKPAYGIDIDIFYDNCIRANCLYQTIKILKSEEYDLTKNEKGNEFYIIHPILKHISIMSLDT